MVIRKNPVLSFVIALYRTSRDVVKRAGVAGGYAKPLHTEKENVGYASKTDPLL